MARAKEDRCMARMVMGDGVMGGVVELELERSLR
jgi:hypothetical protein